MTQRTGFLFVVALVLAGCAVVPNASTGTDTGAHPKLTVSDAMLADVSAPADAQFIDTMLAHHQAAIAMANQALRYADRDELRTYAAAVIRSQGVEVQRMRAWRAEWFPDQAATAAQVDAEQDLIASDRAQAFDQRFMEAMIRHQEEAVRLAQEADGKVQHDQLQTLIKSIIAQQGDQVIQLRNYQQSFAQG